MNRLRLKLRMTRLLLALGVVSAVWACNAPFIPVPPPGQTQTASFTSELVTDSAGVQKTVWVTHGGPNSRAAFARFFVLDTNLGAGVIATATADGSYQSPAMDGMRGDRVEIFFELATGARSTRVCFLLSEGAALLCPPP
jgi:hypothetical protein